MAGLAWRKGYPRMDRKPRNSSKPRAQAAMLRAYLRELRCVDEYIKQAPYPLPPAPYLPWTMPCPLRTTFQLEMLCAFLSTPCSANAE